MKAFRIVDSSRQPTLIECDIAQPVPPPGELLVRVRAAGVTPTELGWYPTTHLKNGDPRNGAVPAHEFCGEIAAVGNGVTGFFIGQEIYGMNDWFMEGALAEYCVTRPEWIAPKPGRISFCEAAAVPIGALTAWQGLFGRAKLLAGERLLIHGGAGAVGVFAIQLAHWHGAHVITTVSARNSQFVRELGADQVIDCQAAPFEEAAREMDVVFDTVGGDTLRRSWSVLRPQGRLVTVAADNETTSDARAKAAFFLVQPNAQQLLRIGELLTAGQLRPVVDKVVPFSQAAAAFMGTVARQRRGKLVVLVAESAS